jgi:DNA repair exonuclease SbcCD ATPase subunit
MQVFRETLRMSQERVQNWTEESAEKVKKERANFQIRRKNLTDLNSTKSKLNYLSKINEEMQAIKEYQVCSALLSKWSNLFRQIVNIKNLRWLDCEIGKGKTGQGKIASRVLLRVAFTDLLFSCGRFASITFEY